MSASDDGSQEGRNESEVSDMSYGPTRRLNGKRVCGEQWPQEEEREGGGAEEVTGSAEEEEEESWMSSGYDDSSVSGGEVDELYPTICKQHDG